MQIATFFVPTGDATAQEELNAFLRGHRVLRVEKVFADGGWSFCVEWLEGKSSAGAGDWHAKRIDYREVLDAETFARFSTLRERRKRIAHEDGVPPYMVMTDVQMAEAAKAEKLTEAVLAGIEGLGPARVQKYGNRLMSDITEGSEK